MNTKGNQRYQQTKSRIKGVFLKLIAAEKPKISVSEICKMAHIHRTTFYGHYEDVNALLKEMVGEMYMEIMEYFLPQDDVYDETGFLKLFELVQEQRHFFRYYFEHVRQVDQSGQLLPKRLEQQMTVVMAKMGYGSEEELRYNQAFFSAGLTAVLNRWILRGCKESVEEMYRIIDRQRKIYRTE